MCHKLFGLRFELKLPWLLLLIWNSLLDGCFFDWALWWLVFWAILWFGVVVGCCCLFRFIVNLVYVFGCFRICDVVVMMCHWFGCGILVYITIRFGGVCGFMKCMCVF